MAPCLSVKSFPGREDLWLIKEALLIPRLRSRFGSRPWAQEQGHSRLSDKAPVCVVWWAITVQPAPFMLQVFRKHAECFFDADSSHSCMDTESGSQALYMKFNFKAPSCIAHYLREASFSCNAAC
jgi:hypothetical protein